MTLPCLYKSTRWSDSQHAKTRKKLICLLLPDLVFPFKMYLSPVDIPVLCSRKVNTGIKPFSLIEKSLSWQFFETFIGIPIFMWDGNSVLWLVLKPFLYHAFKARR